MDPERDIKCKTSSVEDCQMLNKLIGVLSFYSLMTIYIREDKELLFSYLKESGLSVLSLLDLLGHVMSEHVDKSQNKEERDSEFELLCSLVASKMDKVCDLSLCDVLRRHNRVRSKDAESDNFLFDLLDSVHVLFMHSYDNGYRMRGYGGDDDECLKVDTVKDQKFEEMKKKVKAIRERVKSRVISGKFNTEVNSQDNEEEMTQNPADIDGNEYSFGKRFYYWDYHKNNNDEDVPHNPGSTYDQMSVRQKFENLREEITENHFQSMSFQCYRRVMKTAKYHLDKNEVKKIRFNDNTHCIGYGIDRRDVVRCEHLMALLCYTDYTDFSYWFSKSFRKKNQKESQKQLMQRNGNYFFMSKYLRELVECFGTKTDSPENKVKYFYMGISREVLFPSYLVALNGPTSTTTQLPIALLFAQRNGMIVTLTNYDCYSFFNCSLLSKYLDEDERLFMGGYGRMRIFNIRTVKRSLNYIHFIAPITKFDMICNSEEDISGKLGGEEVMIIGALINHYLNKRNNKYPLFVNQLFASLIENKKRIKIDLSNAQCIGDLAIIFMSKETQSLVKMDYLCEIFPNLEYIEIKYVRKTKKMDQKKDCGKYERCDNKYDENVLDLSNQTVLDELKSQFRRIQRIGSTGNNKKHSKEKPKCHFFKIVLKGVNLNGNSEIDNDLDQYIRFEAHSNPKYENMIVEVMNNNVNYNDDSTNEIIELKRKLEKVQKENKETQSALELKNKIISNVVSTNDELRNSNQKHVEAIELLGALCDDNNIEIKRLKSMINNSLK